MSSQPLGDRSNYQRGRLDANDLLPDPVDQFHRWVNEAIAEQVPELSLIHISEPTRPY